MFGASLHSPRRRLTDLKTQPNPINECSFVRAITSVWRANKCKRTDVGKKCSDRLVETNDLRAPVDRLERARVIGNPFL